ncbi:kinase-like domain-containing protein, partial [Mycena rosella]
FDVLRQLGKGATARVLLVRHKATQKEYALKIVPKTGRTSVDAPLEQQVLRSLNGAPYLLRLLASWHDSSSFYILTPWYEGGDLATHLLLEGKMSRERAKFYLAQLIIALEELHSRRIIHRDVRPGNVFFDGDGNAVLGDLGCGKGFPLSSNPDEPDYIEFVADPNASCGSFRWEACTTTERCGTPAFMSPDQHCGRDYSFDTDVWGLGMTFVYMV